MIRLFIQGGPIMWPILVASIVALTVVIERLIFICREQLRRRPVVIEKILAEVERGRIDRAIAAGAKSPDFVARTLTYGLRHRGEKSVSSALLRAASLELERYHRGLSVLDTIVTLAPLLGLLGTVTGMIHSFGLLGAKELGAPNAITGGIAEALIATAFGLGVAIIALIPFNFLNSKLESARHEIQDAVSHVEIHLGNQADPTRQAAGDRNLETADV
jgi:biopolymer transport protein ExbB